MTALALSLLMKFWPAMLALGGALWWGIRQRRAGAAAVRAEQAAAEQAARDIRDQVDNDLGALTPEQRREELRKHARD